MMNRIRLIRNMLGSFITWRKNTVFFYISFLLFCGCAEDPSHTNIFDPNTPNDPPAAVELRSELIERITNNSITFGWTESGDNDFLKYSIYRSEQPGLQSTLVGENPYPFLTSITDSVLQANTAYYYWVLTEDKGGKITPSNEFKIFTAPDIYYADRMIWEGYFSGSSFYSKMDVVVSGNQSYVFLARVSKEWNLELHIKSFDLNDPTNTGNWQPKTYLIEGDTDGDGAPDLYEIYSNTDPDDPANFPDLNYFNFPVVAPQQIVVFKENNSTNISSFILFSSVNSILIKFTGDLNSNTYSIDNTWYDSGVMKLGFWTLSMTRFSEMRFLISHNYSVEFYSLDGNKQSSFDNPQDYITLLAVGTDSPSGTKFIYVTNWGGRIYKYDENGILITSWRGYQLNASHTSMIGLYADKIGNVFIIDFGLETVNRFNSNGEFISRWYGVNQIFENRFLFSGDVGITGHTSICGDDENNIYIIDQTPLFYRTRIN